MPRTKTRVCDVTGMKTSENNFYKNQSHVKAVDNIRRTTSATKDQLKRMLNDEPDQFGNQGPVVVEQTKEERDAKAPKTYLGNVKVVWTNGTNVDTAPRDNQPTGPAPAPTQVEEDLPF
jgi:hypothetical protein